MKYLCLLLMLCSLCVPVLAQEQPWCGIQVLYFQHNESTSPPGYEELINRPSGNPQVDENITILNTNGWVLIDSYITPEYALSQTTEDLAGLRRYRYYSYVSTAVGTTQLNFTPFLRTPDGGETYFYSAISEDINSLTATEYLTSHVSQTPLIFHNATDRIVIKVYAKTTHSSPVTVHWLYQGTSNTSHVESGYFVCEESTMAGGGGGYAANELPASPVIPMLGICAGIMLYTRRL